MTRFVALVLGITLAAVALTASASGSTNARTGIERVPLQCVANLLDGTLTIGLAAPDSPPGWDIGVPPVGSFANTKGYGFFLGDRAIVVCGREGTTVGEDWGRSFGGAGTCYLARGGGTPGSLVKEYEGKGAALVRGTTVLAACELSLARETPF